VSGPQEQIRNLYGLLVRVASSLQPVLLLCIRVYFGLWPAGIAVNGWGKLHNLGRVTQFFASLGLPAPGATAAFVSTFEFIAGILLAVGLLSRVAALGLVIDMLTAYITSDREALSSFFVDPSKFYNADPFIYLAVALVILIFGPGKIALDYLIEKKYANRSEVNS
jgi:putative oxidoreductase